MVGIKCQWLMVIFLFLFFFCSMTEPRPSYTAFREASFGHGILDIKNRTHAYFSWYRNQDGYPVEADSLWLQNRFWNPFKASSVAAI
jgi:hypothetical protein